MNIQKQCKSLFFFVLVLFFNSSYGQQNDLKSNINLQVKDSKRIQLHREPVDDIYWNDWYAYKLDNGELVLISEGKTKEIRAIILFNCQNDKYVIYSLTNFGNSISEKEFKELVPN